MILCDLFRSIARDGFSYVIVTDHLFSILCIYPTIIIPARFCFDCVILSASGARCPSCSGGYYSADGAVGSGQDSVVKPGSRQGMSRNYAGEPDYTFSG